MKRILSAALALSLLGGSAAMAQPYGNAYGHDRHDSRYDRRDERRDDRAYRHDRRDDRRAHHRWARGDRMPPQYRTRGYYVDYRSHHLRQPPRGYQWVRADDDYVLVALATGLIASIVANQ